MKNVFAILFFSIVTFGQSRILNWPNDTVNIYSWQLHKNTIVSVSSKVEIDRCRTVAAGSPITITVIDTIKGNVTIGTKTWKFLPVANQ